MELLYLWVDKFRKLEKKGYNFSSELHFHTNYYIENDIEQLDFSVGKKALKLNYSSIEQGMIPLIVTENLIDTEKKYFYANFLSYKYVILLQSKQAI